MAPRLQLIIFRILLLSAAVVLCVGEEDSLKTLADLSSPAPDPVTDTNKVSDTETDTNTNRTRRSDVLGLFNTKFHRKFALLGSLSSSNPHIPETAPDCHGQTLTYDHKAFSLWGFKKAIFSTLLQAIKAITGGVIALKGQIIKVKGHLIAAKGHLLQTKGEAISDFGRHIATKALLTPVQVPPSATGLSAYGHTGTGSGIGASGPGYPAAKPVYGPPSASAPASGYGAPPPKPVYGAPHKPLYGVPPSAPSSNYGSPAAKPDSSYGPPPSGSVSSGPSAPAPSPPSGSYGAPPPPLPSTSYGTPIGSGPSSDYSGPPPSSGFGSSGPAGNLYLPPSFPSGPGGFSSPSASYGSPLKREIKLPQGVQAGLLVLKPVRVPPGALDPRQARPPRLRSQPFAAL